MQFKKLSNNEINIRTAGHCLIWLISVYARIKFISEAMLKLFSLHKEAFVPKTASCSRTVVVKLCWSLCSLDTENLCKVSAVTLLWVWLARSFTRRHIKYRHAYLYCNISDYIIYALCSWHYNECSKIILPKNSLCTHLVHLLTLTTGLA